MIVTRSPALAVLAVSAAILGACSTATSAPPHLAVSAAPLPIAGLDWTLTIDTPEAQLAYGTPESDDLRLGLSCRRGDARLEITAARPSPARELLLESGGETERFRVASEPAEVHEGVFLTGEGRTDQPLFQRFRKVGWMAGWQDGRRETYVPHAETAPDIERFFAYCG